MRSLVFGQKTSTLEICVHGRTRSIFFTGTLNGTFSALEFDKKTVVFALVLRQTLYLDLYGRTV